VSDGVTHREILVALILFGIPNLVVGAVFFFQHRLMWNDYRKRHGMNGNGKP
jgi:hypothetical protein